MATETGKVKKPAKKPNRILALLNKNCKVGTFRGVKIYLHSSFILFFILLFLVMIPDLIYGNSVAEHLDYMYMLAIVFPMVLIHEMCHTVEAMRRGIKVHDIRLLPIGGIANIGKNPDTPKDELLIAAAGPLSNFAIGFSLLAINRHLEWDFFTRVMTVNFGLAIFNLIPFFPLDGGRMFRTMMEFRYGKEKATVRAVFYGTIFMILFMTLAVMVHNPLLLVIAFLMGGSGLGELVLVKKNLPNMLKGKMDELWHVREKVQSEHEWLKFLWKFTHDPDVPAPYKCITMHAFLVGVKTAWPCANKGDKWCHKHAAHRCEAFRALMMKLDQGLQQWENQEAFMEAIGNLPEEIQDQAKKELWPPA